MEETMTEELKRYSENISGDERRDRTWFDELTAELTAHANRIESRLHVFYRKALVAIAILGIASTVGLIGFGIVLRKLSEATKQIQNQRFNTLVLNCTTTNDRHKDVIAQIDAAIAAVPKGPQHVAAEKGAKTFKVILSAAVPYTEDCLDYASKRVKGDK